MNRAANNPGRRAFTMAELLVVITLIGILTTGVLVSFRGRTGSYSLKAAAADLSAAFEFAAAEARTRQRNYCIAFDAGMAAYCVMVEVSDGRRTELQPVPGSAGVARRLPGNVRVVSVLVGGKSVPVTSTSFEVHPDGSGFAGVIRLSGRSGERADIEVLPETGQLHVEFGH